MHPSAALALKALDLKHRCGPYAGRRFAAKHAVTPLYRLAQQLHAVKDF